MRKNYGFTPNLDFNPLSTKFNCLQRYRIIVEFECEFEFDFEFGVRDGDHLALRICAIAMCACVAPVRRELGFCKPNEKGAGRGSDVCASLASHTLRSEGVACETG